MPGSGARSTSRSNSNISMMDTYWNWNSDCAPQAESRCPGKANQPEGACRQPVCKGCSEVCPKCSIQWSCEDCFPMNEHNCTSPLIQTIQYQARLAEAKTPREFLASEAQLAERARLNREEMIATMAEVRKTFEAERLALARASREREQELAEQ
eukprot:9475581-Pyramimonas_sp.AAC.1